MLKLFSPYYFGTNCPEVVKTGERHTPLPGRIRAPPMRRAFSADRTAAPQGGIVPLQSGDLLGVNPAVGVGLDRHLIEIV